MHGAILPGQLTTAGTRTPPSRSVPLPPEKGAFDAGGLASRGTPPLSARSSGDRAPVANKAFVAPPLSEVTKTSVFSRIPFFSSVAMIRPTCRSALVIMAA